VPLPAEDYCYGVGCFRGSSQWCLDPDQGSVHLCTWITGCRLSCHPICLACHDCCLWRLRVHVSS
jgi:hypothetical protein